MSSGWEREGEKRSDGKAKDGVIELRVKVETACRGEDLETGDRRRQSHLKHGQPMVVVWKRFRGEVEKEEGQCACRDVAE